MVYKMPLISFMFVFISIHFAFLLEFVAISMENIDHARSL